MDLDQYGERMADDIVFLMDELGLGRAHLDSHSLGALARRQRCGAVATACGLCVVVMRISG